MKKMNGKPGGRRLTLSFRQGLTGVLFISPWLIGVTVFFLLPFFNTVTYMFGKVTVSSQGVDFAFTGLENIREVFFRDPDNGRMIFECFWFILAMSSYMADKSSDHAIS